MDAEKADYEISNKGGYIIIYPGVSALISENLRPGFRFAARDGLQQHAWPGVQVKAGRVALFKMKIAGKRDHGGVVDAVEHAG